MKSIKKLCLLCCISLNTLYSIDDLVILFWKKKKKKKKEKEK